MGTADTADADCGRLCGEESASVFFIILVVSLYNLFVEYYKYSAS